VGATGRRHEPRGGRRDLLHDVRRRVPGRRTHRVRHGEQASALFAFLGISYAQRVGAHIRMDLLLRGFSLRVLWSMELFAVLVALVVIVVLVDTTWLNFMRAYELGDSTIDIKLPTWPTKLLVPIVLAVLTVRLTLQSLDYMRLIAHPDAVPIAVPVIETIEVQAQHEIEEALGREEKRP
jgi:C4-dicarboxylate transporter, DctQ subunit